MTAPSPDREAAVQAIAGAMAEFHNAAWVNDVRALSTPDEWIEQASAFVAAGWCSPDEVAQQTADARQEGRDEAAAAIEASPESTFVRVKDYCWRFDDDPPLDCDPCPGHDNGDGHHVMHGRSYFAKVARGEQP